MIKLISSADLVSILNALLGFLSILMICLDNFRLAYSFIFLALLADGLDGIIARRFSRGELGEYLESTADMISMGVAPALFVYKLYYDIFTSGIFKHFFAYIVLIIFVSLCIVRLSSFHVMKKKDFFVGLPASAATIVILVFSYIKIDFVYILPIIFFISFLMVSNINFPKTGLKINSAAAVLLIFNIIAGGYYHNIAPIMLSVGILLYIVIGSLYIYRQKNRDNLSK